MDISITGTLLAALLLFGHIIAVAATALVAFGVLNVLRRQPDIRYLFWMPFIGGTLAWGYTARLLATSELPFRFWSHTAFTWYAVFMFGGLVLGIFLQRRRM
jgi:hypothetical protein